MFGTIRNRPGTLYLLLALLIFLGLGGVFGGAAMLVDPSGRTLGLPPDLLDAAPVDTYVLPGLFLVSILGILPLFAGYGAWALPSWSGLQRLNPWPGYHWSWAWSRVIAVILILFIGLEFLLWGNQSPLQPIMLAVGLALLVMCGYPSIRRYMRIRGEAVYDDAFATEDLDRSRTPRDTNDDV